MRQPTACLMLIFSIILSGCVSSDPFVTLHPSSGGWGSPVNGLRCSIASYLPTTPSGGPYVVEIAIQNVSDREIAVLVGSPYRRSGRLSLARGDEEMHEGHFGPIAGMAPPPITPEDFVRLRPQKVQRFSHLLFFQGFGVEYLQHVQKGFADVKTGRYLMTYHCRLSSPKDGRAIDLGGLNPWEGGELVSAPAAVNVASRTASRTVSQLLAAAKLTDNPAVRAVYLEGIAELTCRRSMTRHATDGDFSDLDAWWMNHHTDSWQEWIVSALSGSDPDDRELAARRVHLVDGWRFARRLASVLDPSDPGISDRVFEALWVNYHDRRALKYAREALAGPHVSDKLFYFIRRNKITELYPDLLARLEIETDKRRLRSLLDLTFMLEMKQAIPLLEKLMQREDFPLKERIVISLSSLKGTDYEEELLKHIESEDPTMRRWAAWCLHQSGTRRCIEPLINALSDDEADVVVSAVFSLKTLAQYVTPSHRQRIVVLLKEQLNDGSPRHEDHHYTNSIRNLIAMFKVGLSS